MSQLGEDERMLQHDIDQSLSNDKTAEFRTYHMQNESQPYITGPMHVGVLHHGESDFDLFPTGHTGDMEVTQAFNLKHVGADSLRNRDETQTQGDVTPDASGLRAIDKP